jgi:uncharacterized protein YjiS (DUF1127 family)
MAVATDQLPRLMSTRQIMDELGVTRAKAEAIIRRIPKQEIPGCRALLVRRDDVQRVLDQHLRDA